MSALRGYALSQALRKESDDIANDERRELVRNAADEIERLIMEYRAMKDSYDRAQAALLRAEDPMDLKEFFARQK